MSSSSSLSSSAASTTATATTAPQTSRLTTVFAIHRFIAGGFGCMLYFVPQILNESFGRTDNLKYWHIYIHAHIYTHTYNLYRRGDSAEILGSFRHCSRDHSPLCAVLWVHSTTSCCLVLVDMFPLTCDPIRCCIGHTNASKQHAATISSRHDFDRRNLLDVTSAICVGPLWESKSDTSFQIL